MPMQPLDDHSGARPSQSPATASDAPLAGAGTPAPEMTVFSEQGGPTGPEPTRYGDWEQRGRCIDF